MSEYSDYREWLDAHGCRTWDEMVSTYGENTATAMYADYRSEQRQSRLF